MLGIDTEVSYRRLNVDSHHKSMKQKRKAFNQERYEAIEAEIESPYPSQPLK